MAICHSSGIGETKSYSPGLGFWGVSGSICFRFEVKLNSNHWERGREKWLGERVPRVPRGSLKVSFFQKDLLVSLDSPKERTNEFVFSTQTAFRDAKRR